MAIFDPSDFLSLAQSLGATQNEASQRTAISRAYYSCHLTARDQLYGVDGVGLTNTVKKRLARGKVGDHTAVILAVAQNPHLGMGRAKNLADELGQLKALRETADYIRDSGSSAASNIFTKYSVSDWSSLTRAAMGLASNVLPKLRRLRP